jgi:hypothetical protein
MLPQVRGYLETQESRRLEVTNEIKQLAKGLHNPQQFRHPDTGEVLG